MVLYRPKNTIIENRMRKILSRLHWQVALALILAVLTAAILRIFDAADTEFGRSFEYVFTFVGKLFMNLLSMIVVPLVVTSVVCGSMGLGRGGQLVRVGVKTIAFYAITGILALSVSLLIVNVLCPGCVEPDAAGKILGDALAQTPAVNANSADVAGVLLKFFPPNIIAAASDNTQILGLIIFAVIMGIFINFLPPKYAEFQRKFWASFNSLFEHITNMIMRLLPIGVFGLTAPVCIRAGADAIEPVLAFFATVVLSLGVHMFITMSLILKAWGIPPLKHMRAMFPALLTAFSTSSSIATLPVTLECVENSARVPKKISGFTLPLGATVNMNGSALYECAAVMFISQIYASAGGEPMGLFMQITVMLLALLTSIGVAGIPSASLVAIVLIMGVAGIPAEAIGIIWMTDRILDMLRTCVNIYGDSCAAVWIAKTEKYDVYPEIQDAQ